MSDKLANINHSAVPFLSRAAANLSWYDSMHFVEYSIKHNFKKWIDLVRLQIRDRTLIRTKTMLLQIKRFRK